MASQSRPLDEALDEMVFRDEGALMEMQGVHDNSILFYFARSPWFDRSSNNGLLYNQALYNPKLFPLLQTRAMFEGRLKTMSGLEYIVAEQPAEMAPGTGTGVWVIRKQTRRKRAGMEDEITVHGSYFVVNDHIYQAPSVADVLGSKLMAVSTTLSKFISQAATLSQFSPALGHTYASPDLPAKPKIGGLDSTSKEATPLPDSQQSSKKLDASSQTDEQLSNQLLADTINISLKYGDEYMDENLVTGYPGSFHLSKIGKKEPEKGKLTVPVLAKPAATPKPSPTLAVKTDVPAQSAKKAAKIEKSPKTPGAPKPKRRKSKPNVNVAGGGNVSPT